MIDEGSGAQRLSDANPICTRPMSPTCGTPLTGDADFSAKYSSLYIPTKPLLPGTLVRRRGCSSAMVSAISGSVQWASAHTPLRCDGFCRGLWRMYALTRKPGNLCSHGGDSAVLARHMYIYVYVFACPRSFRYAFLWFRALLMIFHATPHSMTTLFYACCCGKLIMSSNRGLSTVERTRVGQ